VVVSFGTRRPFGTEPVEPSAGAIVIGRKRNTGASSRGEGPGLFEIVENRGDTYRAIYTVKFEHALYVLHAFQKKSPKGIKTAQTDVELISKRLKTAADDYEARYGKHKN
jgi:phage-related protein